MPDFLSDITKLTPEHAISPYYIFKYVENNGDFVAVFDAKKDPAGKIQKVQELLITAMLVAAKEGQLPHPCIYIAPFEGERPDTAIYNVDIQSNLRSRILCEITVRTAWPKADDIETLIKKKQTKKYPEKTAVIVFCDVPSDRIDFSKLHTLVQKYSNPYDTFLIYGTTRGDIEGMNAKEISLNLYSYTLDEPLILCLQVNQIRNSGGSYLRLPIEVRSCSIKGHEFKYDPPYIQVNGNDSAIPS